MKNLFFIMAISAILFSSCGNNSTIKTETHKHEDGSEHVNHNNTSNVAPEQELFDIDNDSLSIKNDTLKSEHEKEHSHSHDGGHEHNH